MKFDHRFQLLEQAPSRRVYAADGVTMRLDFFDHILRVALIRDGAPLFPTWSVCPGGGEVPLEGRDRLSTEGFSPCSPAAEEDERALRFSLDASGARMWSRPSSTSCSG